MKLSVVIPAHNEEGSIYATVVGLAHALTDAQILHEILVINDNSKDQTEVILKKLALEFPSVRYLNNQPPNGYGLAVRKGLDNFTGDAVVVCMADASEEPKDVVRYYQTLLESKTDCVFGSRFLPESKVVDYPPFKLWVNRVVNQVIRILFFTKYNDMTNGFKLFKRNVIEGTKPYWSDHFSLALEIPLKALVRGFTFTVVPNDWLNRKSGEAKLNLRKMFPQYFRVLFRCFLEQLR